MKTQSTQLHPAEDYELLRREGLAYIQQLSGKLWTDFNVHDPGVTMLEILAFALADLGFRAGHPINDLLAPEPGESPELKQFFTLAEIATTRPWTIDDYRRVLIDMPDVANAWLSRSQAQEVFLYLNEQDREFWTSRNPQPEQTNLLLNGLYEVAIRFEEDRYYGDLNDNSVRFWQNVPRAQDHSNVAVELEIEFPFQSRLPARLRTVTATDIDAFVLMDMGLLLGEQLGWYYTFKLPARTSEQYPEEVDLEFVCEVHVLQPQALPMTTTDLLAVIGSLPWWKTAIKTHFLARRDYIAEKLKSVRTNLLGQRNLCEDFFVIVPMNLQEIALDLEIELATGTDLQATEVAIYRAVNEYLDPPLRFYSLAEMLEKGRRTTEIFDGPLLENGFLDGEELKLTAQRKAVFGSDILQLIMGVEGVVVVRSLAMSNRIAGDTVAEGVTDCIVLTETGRFQPTVDAKRSRIRFSHSGCPPQVADKVEVLNAYRSGLLGRVPYKGLGQQMDMPTAYGRSRNLRAYTSVQTEFPEAWGIGAAGLPQKASPTRVAQAQQLKGFLYFFEQLLCNYLAQLSYIKRLLAVQGGSSSPTYLSKVAWEIPRIKDLLVPPNLPGKNQGPSTQQEFEELLQSLWEDNSSAAERRSRLLDHLLARFNTSMTAAATLSWKKQLVPDPAAHWIAAKERVLRHFPRLGSSRALGFDYAQMSRHCLPLSGFQKRLCMLLGWDVPDAFRLDLGTGNDAGTYRISVVDGAGTVLLTTQSLAMSKEPHLAVETMLDLILQPVRFEIKANVLELRTDQGEKVAWSQALPSLERAQAVYAEVVQIASKIQLASKIVVVEHILLRPKRHNATNYDLMVPYLSQLADFDVRDPWSCRLSVVFPHDLKHPELDNEDWRRLIQQTIREELPAHLLVQFLWLDNAQYSTFLSDYRRWRAEMYRNVRLGDPVQSTLSNAINLPARMTMLKNLFGAQCVLAAPKMTTQYEDGESIAQVYDPDGYIVKAWVSHYSEAITDYLIPSTGQVHLDRQTGRLYVKQVEGLNPVTDLDFSFATMNQAGGITHHKVFLTLLKDDGPLLAVLAPKYDFQFAQDDKVAWIDARSVIVVGVEWFGGSAPNNYLQLNPVNGDVTVSDPIALFRAVRAVSGFTLKVPLKLKVKNHQGYSYTVRKDLIIKQSHDAVAEPHPDFAQPRPASYFAEEGRYLYEIADAQDGGIRRVIGKGNQFDLETWGLGTTTVGRPEKIQLKIVDLPQFLKTFARTSQKVLNARFLRLPIWSCMYECEAIDAIGNITAFKLPLQFIAESALRILHRPAWTPSLVTGKIGVWRGWVSLSDLSHTDGGITTLPTVMDLPARVTFSNTGLEFAPMHGTLPYVQLQMANPDKFSAFAKKYFQLDVAKVSSTFDLHVQTVNGNGGSVDATLRLVLEDTPATIALNPKYATTLSIADASAETLAEVSDVDDGGIVVLREPDGGTKFTDWGLKWATAGTPAMATISIDNLTQFKAHFQHRDQLNTLTGLFEDGLELITVDGMGFEKRLRMRLRFSAAPVISTDNPATWQSVMETHLIADYASDKTVGYIADVDGGLLSLPTILAPHDVLWSSTGLAFTKTKDTLPRLQLKVKDGAVFATFVRTGTGLSKDEYSGTADFTFRVAVEDLQNHRQELTISLPIQGTNAIFTAGEKLADPAYLLPLAVRDCMYLVTDPADGGIVGLEPNLSEPAFAAWGLEAVPDTQSKGMNLRIADLQTFKGLFNPRLLSVLKSGKLERQLSVIATDFLGFKSVRTLDFRFTPDTSATWTPAFTSKNYAEIGDRFVFGWIKDPEEIQKIDVTGNPFWNTSGLVFELDKAKAPDWALRVTNLTSFQTVFNSMFAFDTQSRKYLCNFDVKVTDAIGHTSDIHITLRVNEIVTNALPTWTIAPGFDGSKVLEAVADTNLVATIFDVEDGGVTEVAEPIDVAQLALWGLKVHVDSPNKTGVLEVVDATKFIKKMELSRIQEGSNWKATFRILVTDLKKNKDEVQIPVLLHIDNAPVWEKAPGLGLLGSWASGTLLGTFSDSSDGGIVSYKILEAAGYTTTGNDLVVVLENGVVKVKTGDKLKFEQFVGRNFTINPTLRTGTYKIRLETVDQFQGKAEVEAIINLSYAPINVVYVPGLRRPIGALQNGDVLGTLTYSPLFDFTKAMLADGQPPASLGVEVYSEKPGILQLRLADGLKFARTAFEGKMLLNVSTGCFTSNPSLNLDFSFAESFSVKPKVEVTSGALSNAEQYSKLVSPQIKFAISKADFLLKVKDFLPQAVNGSYTLTKGSSLLVSKSSTKSTTYDHYYTFTEAFLNPKSGIPEVEYEGTFKYNATAPIEGWKCKFTFVPAL